MYSIPIDQELKLTGLTQKLKNDIGKIFIDLDDPIELYLSKLQKDKDCSKENCNNFLYYPYDGHLNERGHWFLYKYLYAN